MLYWLSKRGFECARVDHTGIDLIARRPGSTEVLGISVKCRSRDTGSESTGINFLVKEDSKIRLACKAFRCTPYVGFLADQGDVVRGFLISLKHARRISQVGSWRMTLERVLRYKKDRQIELFELENRDGDWDARV